MERKKAREQRGNCKNGEGKQKEWREEKTRKEREKARVQRGKGKTEEWRGKNGEGNKQAWK